MNDIAPTPDHLPALIDRAASALTTARNSAEVLEARDAARLAYDVAKSAGRIARAKQAHDEVIAAVYRAQADALLIEARAKVRLADEYDAAQERGEVASHGGDRTNVPDRNLAPSAADLGLSRKDIHEARQIRDAENVSPGGIADALDQMVRNGEEPTKARLKREVVPSAVSSRSVGVAGMDQDELVEEVVGLREENTELRERLKASKAEVEKLKAQLKDFTGDKDQVIRRLNKALELAGSNRWRAEEKANAVLRHNHVLKKRVKELENLPIAMD